MPKHTLARYFRKHNSKWRTPIPEYATWTAMKGRCYNPHTPGFKNYGGRGIKVCERWKNSYDNFFSDMGPKPTPKHSIDRIDVNGNYEPSNCRWATKLEQMRNMRKTLWITFRGKTLSFAEHVKREGIIYPSAKNRLVKGLSMERVFSKTPLYETKPRGESHGMSKLDDAKVFEIRRLRKTGISFQKLADLFGVTQGAVVCVVQRITWAHVK